MIDVMTALSAAKRRFKMKTFTIDQENNISVFATAEEAAAASTTPFDAFASEKELAELVADWPAERLVATYNSLPGVAPVKAFKSAQAAASRIWQRIQKLGASEEPKAEQPNRPKASKKAKRGAQSAKGAPAKGKATKKATAAKAAPKAKKAAKAKEATGPREGSKMAQAIAMMSRKDGATTAELIKKLGWLPHTLRGFCAGALKKAGYKVESYKDEKTSARTYRLNP